MVSWKLAEDLASVSNESAGRIKNALSGVDDSQVVNTFSGKFGEELGQTPDRALSRGQQTILGTAAIGAGGAALWKGSEAFEARQDRLQQEAQAGVVEDILTDPHLSGDQKFNALKRLRERGFFDRPGDDDPGDDSGLSNFLSDLGLKEYIVILVLVYFTGKAIAGTTQGG